MEIDAILFYLFWFPWTQSFIETEVVFLTHSDWLACRKKSLYSASKEQVEQVDLRTQATSKKKF